MRPARVLFTTTLALSALVFSIFLFSSKVAALGPHVVISQIQVGATGKANQEFVELYNPTESAVSIAGWRLARSASNSATLNNLAASLSGSIKSHGYLLVANPDYTNATVSADLTYSATTSAITNNNTIYLFSDAGITTVDKVGMGTAQNSEGATAPNPVSDQSIVRKASSGSTPADLAPGGAEGSAGNGFDDDNNVNDFVVFTTALPRNSQSPVATPSNTPTPTLSPTSSLTPTPTNSPTPSVSLSPTDSPTPSLSPTDSPTPIITDSPTPTETPFPTLTDTPTVTLSLTPTDISTPTPTPTLTPTATPEPTLLPTPSDTPSLSPTPIPTETPSPTLSPTDTPTNTPSPTPTASLTPSETPTPTDTPTPTIIPSPSPTETPSPTPTETPVPTPSDTPTITPSPTDSPTPSPTDSVTPTIPPTAEATLTPTETPTITDTPTASPTVTPTGENQRLGGMNLDAYCASLGEGSQAFVDGQIWSCGNGTPAIAMTSACKQQYSRTDVFAHQDLPNNAYSWTCYTGVLTPTPTLSAFPFNRVCTWKLRTITFHKFKFTVPFFQCSGKGNKHFPRSSHDSDGDTDGD